MKEYNYITPREINRLAFKAHLSQLKFDASGMKLLGKKCFYQEAAKYLINIEKAMHRIERSAIKSGFGFIEEKLLYDNTASSFRQGVQEAKSELIEILVRHNPI